MKSSIREKMDMPYTSWHNQPALRIFEEVTAEGKIDRVKCQNINRDAVEWLGYFYSKWHFLTGESSKTIVKFLNPVSGLKNYYVLHQLEETEAIERCKRLYNLSRNKHRRNEVKNSDENKMRYDDPIYYSFLSVRMLYKLSKNEVFNNLNYIGDFNGYDFVDESYSIGIKSDVIFFNNDSSISDRFKFINESISKCNRKANTSIFFCFVFSKYYEIDDNNDEKIFYDLTDIKRKYLPNNRQFQNLYFYLLGKIYQITSSNEIYVYSMPFSRRERIGILNKMEELGL